MQSDSNFNLNFRLSESYRNLCPVVSGIRLLPIRRL
jgi:hypothetical protein